MAVRPGSEALKLSDLVEEALGREKTLRLMRTRGSVGSFLVARLRELWSGPMLVVSPTSKRAEAFAADVRTYSSGADTKVLPRYDTPPYDRFSAHADIESRRMSLLYALLAADSRTPRRLPHIMMKIASRHKLTRWE